MFGMFSADMKGNDNIASIIFISAARKFFHFVMLNIFSREYLSYVFISIAFVHVLSSDVT